MAGQPGGVAFWALRYTYWLLMTLLLAIGWPIVALHPKLRSRFAERFGFYPAETKQRIAALPDSIWVHASSAGDVRSVVPIIARLTPADRDCVVLSCSTDTGFAAADRLCPELPTIALPIDHPLICRRALKMVRPAVLLLEYTEVWPELALQAMGRGTRVLISNATLSERSLPRYRKANALLGPVWKGLDAVLARDSTQADRFRQLGVRDDRLHVTGSTKYDAAQQLLETTAPTGQGAAPIDVLFGSTHCDEFELIVDCLARLLTKPAERSFSIAPRYLTDLGQLAGRLNAANIGYDTRTSPAAEPQPVRIIDTIGDLAGCYRRARVAVIGGSFNQRGGQNPLEPAVFGVPVVTGPNMANFGADMPWLLQAGARRVNDRNELIDVLERLLEDDLLREQIGEALVRGMNQRAGAAAKAAEFLSNARNGGV